MVCCRHKMGISSIKLVFSALGCCICCISLVKGSNLTLIFQNERSFRNCSCSSSIPECNVALANILCCCSTISSKELERASPALSYSTQLAVWVSDISSVGVLLNNSFVLDLRLSLCSTRAVVTEYIIIFGLRRLCVFNPKAQEYPRQNITIHSTDTGVAKLPSLSHRDISFYVAFLNVALLNGDSKLKAYSVPNITNIEDYFPHLPTLPSATNTSLITFIYV
ncbi:uncharacterized protein C21orf62 [Callorhinchus milii]|uniref:Exosomal polycystin 1 interacting protein n=1 Tax=Callorhinchus milii TaxID=7868 RepID=V9L6A2_CALMI|nr:uncharacterized protein C21orf62 [Callorhinchus milii]XP_042190604.1 uncharacterized protein C21orf62 [Callorhinchus milii]XP_042190605.1 uncharacterized protein C21orf62 [Callorhinchus milii]XP_042190606.1 uncharacterized protein C21orf62 [Callorhinchus milii]XP_042190607.1 uncharacterized protein C21orf62 [Callorhinchus milii]XP_042190608.1 uncharacterized protein C21orf62 [Callorhinchus milii]XP_042190609.1 uncharacterized protein C21orf62 [Callorhinchus milii]XP_042190610.1 uncharacte|eukprot:gi/632975340/ref/XP_007904174.1/ PREDICTED: uncharacterized protein C21orf62 homolog [Callorhinchus milii]